MEIKKKFGLQDLYVKLAAWEDLLVEPASLNMRIL
jgi:hypothetical protein